MRTTTRFLLLCGFLSMSCISSVMCQASMEGRDFSIAWADIPVYTIDTLNNEELSVVSEIWQLNIEDETHPVSRFTLTREVYPAAYMHSDSSFNLVDGFINSTQNALIEDELNNDFIAASDSNVNNYYGKVYRYKNKQTNEYFRIRVYLIENVIYQLGVYSRDGASHNLAIDEYFDSFQINDKLKGNYDLDKEEYVQSYSIYFSEEPEYIKQVVDSEVGKLTLHIKMQEPELDLENGFYMSSEIRYPSDVVDTGSEYELDKFYMNSINGALNAVNGDLISIHNIKYKEHHGKEYLMYISGGQYILTYRVFYVNDVLYCLGVMSNEKSGGNDSMITFMDSFRIN